MVRRLILLHLESALHLGQVMPRKVSPELLLPLITLNLEENCSNVGSLYEGVSGHTRIRRGGIYWLLAHCMKDSADTHTFGEGEFTGFHIPALREDNYPLFVKISILLFVKIIILLFVKIIILLFVKKIFLLFVKIIILIFVKIITLLCGKTISLVTVNVMPSPKICIIIMKCNFAFIISIS